MTLLSSVSIEASLPRRSPGPTGKRITVENLEEIEAQHLEYMSEVGQGFPPSAPFRSAGSTVSPEADWSGPCSDDNPIEANRGRNRDPSQR